MLFKNSNNKAKKGENQANSWIHETFINALDNTDTVPDYFFCSYGTGGTFIGVAKYLRKHSPETQIHVCEPDNAPPAGVE